MKGNLLTKVASVSLAALSLTALVSAKGFSKTITYNDGQFTDVAEKAWYASDVKSAYELGFVNGKSENLYVPEGNVTVAEGITMATRVHSIYNGKTIAEKSGGKWYDMYIAYAEENGIVKNGQFENFDRNIMRYEMALLFANAMPKEYFTPKNDIKDIPDVDAKEEYYDELMMLYKAGVVLGSDDYGNFYATNSIKRSETAAIINRVALPENRVSGVLKEYGDREQAVYLIDDTTMRRTPRNQEQTLASGWTYEDMSNPAINADFTTSNSLGDSVTDGRIAIHRDVTVQTKGVVEAESVFTVSKNNGAEIIFEDIDGTQLFKLALVDEKYVVYGDKEQNTNVTANNFVNEKRIYFALDLDNKTAKVIIDGVDAGTYSMNANAKNLARMSYATTDKDTLQITVENTQMYVNYIVNDTFRTHMTGKAPYGWTTNGNVTVEYFQNAYEKNSVKMNGKASAYKKFTPVGDKFVFEAFVLPTKSGKGYVALCNGNDEALKIEFDASEFVADGKTLREFDERVWQLIRIEGDTEADKAVVKINNKEFGTVALTKDSFDGVKIVNNTDDALMFDDIEVYNVYDYADYVPTPVPVTDDEWIVGMSVCSLWREGTHYGWDAISPYDEIESVLGYYDEGLSEVADWEIKFFVEHGYDFQHYCWYLGSLGSAPIKDTNLNDAIIDGYLNAKYSDMMDMMIMWENQSCSKTSPEFFYDYVWPYWCEWFFSDARYLRIDNKAPITLYSYSKFIENMGGMENAKKAVAFMREDIKRLGYDDIILFACPTFTGYNEAKQKECKELGVEALVSYTFGELSYEAKFQKDETMKSYNYNVLPLMPCIGVGFNDVGWTEERTPLATVEAHKEVMEWAKDTYMPLLAEREKDEWMSKFVFHTTWNEYGEGHYIMPANLNKFGYVDANRQVFSSVAGKDDKAHFDIEPTLNQKARLAYLYPARNVPMKREMYLDTNTSILENEVVMEWDFEKPEDVARWTAHMQTTPPVYDEKEKALVSTTTGTDGNIHTTSIEANHFNADKARYMYVRIKYDSGKAADINFFYKAEYSEAWTAQKGFAKKSIVADGTYQDVIIDLSGNALWSGDIAGIRFDPMAYVGNYYIKKIAFLAETSGGSYTLNIDGVESTVLKNFVSESDDGLLVAANPYDGFYSMLNLYHEYNRKNGTLDIYGKNGSEMNFVVGSNVVMVDGKEVKLAKATEKIDGLVVVPVELLCETFGYKLEINGRNINITVREKSNEVVEKKENHFEFNTPSDLEGFKLAGANGGIVDGCVGLNPTPVNYVATGYDPQLVNSTVYIETKYYNSMEIRLKTVYDDASKGDGDRLSVYFATTLDGTLNEAKSFKSTSYGTIEKDSEGFMTIKIDCTKNANWNGAVTQLRIDPGNYAGYYQVDYVRISPNESTASLLAAELDKIQKASELLNAVDDGGPFYVRNADAEDTESTVNLTSGSTTVTIVEDDLREGNHAYLLVPANDRQTWTYFRAATRFKGGMTYKVEFDLRIVGDVDGNAGVGVTAKVNPRYTDLVNGVIKDRADHPENKQVMTVSTSDGWTRQSVIFTVKNDLDIRTTDELSIFIDPKGNAQEYTNFCAMIDNIVVSVAE